MEYVQATSRINFDKSRLIWKSSRKSLLATATRKASPIIKGTWNHILYHGQNRTRCGL